MRKILLLITVLCAIGTMAQTTIKMKTGKEIGESFALTVNNGIECYINWGDGKIDTVVSTTNAIEGTVAGGEITLTASGLTYLDCSDQKLNQISFTSASTLETLILSSNKLTAITLTALNGLKTLWIDNNLLTTLDLTRNYDLESLIASNNYITTVKTSSAGLTKLTDCWVDENRLTELSLNGSTKISTLNLEGNTISSLTLSQLDDKALAVFLDGNSLDFTSLWSKTSSLRWYGTEQQGIKFASDTYKIGEEFTVNRNLYNENQDGVKQAPASYSFTWYKYENGVKGAKLTKGTPTSTTADYTVPSGTENKHLFTFKKPFEDIQLEIKNNKYLNFLLLSDHIKIIDPTGIDDANIANNNLSVVVNDGAVTMQAEQLTPVTIYSANGTLQWKGEVQAPVRIQLTKGIYIINKTKIAIK